jgi:hypothetical protein
MASIDEVLNACSSYIAQNNWESEDNKCDNCAKMVNYIKVLLMELKSVQAVIKILYDENFEKKDLDQMQRNTTTSASRDITNDDQHNINGKKDVNEWRTVRDSKKRNNSVYNSTDQPQQIPTIVNRFAILSETTSYCIQQKQIKTINYVPKTRNKTETVAKNKIILIGDSHIKGYSSLLSNQLDKKFEVMGMALPGARLQSIVQLCEQEVSSLTKDDIIILWGGSNDISKNDTNFGLKHLKNFTNKNKDTNILLVAAPHRYDLMETSCVNEEVKVFNRKMHKIMLEYWIMTWIDHASPDTVFISMEMGKTE